MASQRKWAITLHLKASNSTTASPAQSKLSKRSADSTGINAARYDIYPLYWQTNYKNWDWFIFDNDQFGCHYEHVEDNIYEQTIIRQEPFQPIFYTFPDATQYKTGDLFEKHPTLPGHWRSQGRLDNIIVFSNGEKLNPVSIETTVTLHPDIRQALVVGHGYFQAGMILEPAQWPLDEAQKETLIENSWPFIEKANAATVEHGRVARHLVTLSDPAKPFLFSPKGSFRRGAVIKLYKKEIEALFSAEEIIEPAQLDTTTLESLTPGIRSLFSAASPGEDIEDDDDFFLQGIDSLQVINIAKRISAGLKIAGVTENLAALAPRDIYAQSTVAKLSSFLMGRIHGAQSNSVYSQTEVLQDLVDKYSADLTKRSDNRQPAKSTGKTVLLTGSTGSLGSYFLHWLIHDPHVAKIICLNRSADGGRAKQLEASKERGLSTAFDKIAFFHADLSRPNLALKADDLVELQKSVDCIIHNAWPVNFNIAVQSFQGHILGVRHLIDIAQKAAVKASITFISSIGTVDKWSTQSTIPEANLTDLSLAAMGYGQSKQVSSIVLDTAAKLAGVPAAVVRLGQVAGPTTQQGSWNSHEWLPTIIESSVQLGSLPSSLGSMEVDWVPVDQAARIILDMSDYTTKATDFSSGAKFFNLVNPRTSAWSTIAPAVVSFYEQRGKRLHLVSLDEWIKAVENAPSSSNISAIKLLDMYKALAAGAKHGPRAGFATDKAQAASKTLASMEAIAPDLMTLWCQQWNFSV